MHFSPNRAITRKQLIAKRNYQKLGLRCVFCRHVCTFNLEYTRSFWNHSVHLLSFGALFVELGHKSKKLIRYIIYFFQFKPSPLLFLCEKKHALLSVHTGAYIMGFKINSKSNDSGFNSVFPSCVFYYLDRSMP